MKESIESLQRPQTKDADIKRFPTWLIPTAILLGFALLFFGLFRDRILPAPKVEVATVLATSTSDDEKAEASNEPSSSNSSNNLNANAPTAFQASGWVEPDPLPILATTLTDGVVENVYILEGESVEKGQLIAELIDDDTRIARESAVSQLAARQAEADAHRTQVATGQQRIAVAKARVEAAAADADAARDRFERIKDLPTGAIAEAERITIENAKRKAEADHAAALASVEEAKAIVTNLEAICIKLERDIDVAEVALERAQLDYDRTKIHAPINGRVLQLHASPGRKKMLAMDDPHSATIAVLYEPDKLQVRVDVPLADAAGLQIGQGARIRCSLLPERIFHGEVTRITGEADIQRNTLQAKVRIDDPIEALRPEMLCRVEFLEIIDSKTNTSSTPIGKLSTWVPEAAVVDDAVWLCDPETMRVKNRAVRASKESRDNYLRIHEGVQPGEWVVLNPSALKEGQRVNPTLIQP